MYPYVYIQNERNERCWYLIIRTINTDLIVKSVEIWEDSAIRQMLGGRQGLTIDLIHKLKIKCVEDIMSWLNDGKILLVNRQGGHMFLENKHIILKEITSDSFPVDKNDYLNGILSPEGVFTSCDFGSHHKITQNIEDDDNRYITISQDELSKSFGIFIGNEVTKEQESFLKEHLSNLAPDCLKILEKKKII